jgi:hypothetical protein
LHWIRTVKVAGPLKVGHFVRGSIGVGSLVNRLRRGATKPSRWNSSGPQNDNKQELVQITT